MKRNDNFLLQSLCGQNILMDLVSGGMDFTGVTTFNEAGCFLWEAMAEETDIDSLAKALAQKYNIDEALALNDTNAFIESLREDGLLDE